MFRVWGMRGLVVQAVVEVRRVALLLAGGCLAVLLTDGNVEATEPGDLQRSAEIRRPSPDDWSQFRGPGGQGHSVAVDLPLTWSESENITWKVPVEGLGWSSPVTKGKQIWLTTAVDKGKSLQVICLDRESGRQRHRIALFSPSTLEGLHTKNSYASPTPVLEGDRVYVHFGPYGTACLTTEGKVIWKTRLPHKTLYGPSSSPVLLDDLLIVQCHGTDVRFVTALDKKTGKARWRRSHEARSPKRKRDNAESTPLIIQTPAGEQLICNVAGRVLAYEPRTGKSLWSVRQDENYAQVPRPVHGHGLLFTAGGYFSPVVHAIRPGGQGDVTASHVVWSVKKGVPHNPSPLLVGEELFLVSDKGVGSCLDARTGKLHWQQRLGGNFSSSPIFADGRIYLANEQGTTIVLAPGTRFQKLATNKLDGRILASPAVSGKAIYLRTEHHLYRIERKPARPRRE